MLILSFYIYDEVLKLFDSLRAIYKYDKFSIFFGFYFLQKLIKNYIGTNSIIGTICQQYLIGTKFLKI